MTRRSAAWRCVVAGSLLAASVPPWGWWPLAFAGVALTDRLLDSATARQRYWRTTGVAAAWLYPGTFWMVDLTLPGYLVAGAFAASLHGVGAALLVPAGGRGRRPAFVATFVLVELARWSFPFGGVPLATLAMGQADAPLAPTVRLFGSLFLTALVLLGGLALSDLVARRWRPGALLAGVVGVSLLAAGVAPRAEAVDRLDVAVVQGGGPQRTRFNPCNAPQVFQRQLEATALIDRPVDLVVWPENVVNTEPEGTISPNCSDLLYPSEAERVLSDLAIDLDAVLVPGWFREDEQDPTANLNYVVSVEPDGTVSDRYDKVRTVPFGEFVPMRGLLERFSSELPKRDVQPGTGPAVLETSVGTLGVAISWEVFFDHRARDAVNDGAEVLLNPTNGSSYWLTIVQTQQIASSRLRALETDRWVLQASPTGFTAIVTPAGDVIDRIGIEEQGVIVASVELRTGRTLATRFGAWPMVIASFLTLAVVHAAARRDRMAAIARTQRPTNGPAAAPPAEPDGGAEPDPVTPPASG